MCFAGLTPWSNDSPLSKPIKTALEQELDRSLNGKPWSDAIDAPAFIDALTRVGQSRLQTTTAGIAAYQRHPFRRDVPEPESWTGPFGVPVLDYGGQDDGKPVLVVPSLVNKSYIVDLLEDRSFMRFLAAQGCRAYLLDWTAPQVQQKTADLTHYIAGLLVPVLKMLKEQHGQAAVVAGYCMGGTLAVAPAAHHPDLIAGLVLLAAPWDFHADTEGVRSWLTLSRHGLDATLDSFGEAPVDLLQALFAGLDPTLVGRKFRAFAAMDPDSEDARRFVALEDWLNDGVPLSGPVARESLFDWYVENTPAKNAWRVGGTEVRPAKIRCPTLAVIPARDRIVPPRSAEALADAIPNTNVRHVDLGHIGMITGRRAQPEVYEPVADWIKNIASQNK